jgi:hypothetical protein
MVKWLAIGMVVWLLLAVVKAIPDRRTLYRYEVKQRCVFEPVTAPFPNEYSGQSKPPAKGDDFEKFMWERRRGAKPWLRFVRAKITDERYQIHRTTGDIYRLEKGRWVLQGRLFEKPQEFMDSYNGKTPEGCWRSPHSIQQHSYSEQGPWEEYQAEDAK